MLSARGVFSYRCRWVWGLYLRIGYKNIKIQLQKVSTALSPESPQISALLSSSSISRSLPLIQPSPSVTSRTRHGARKPLCLPGGLQWPCQSVSSSGVWALLAHLARPKRGATAAASPCCGSASPLHPAANCTSQGGACNTFHHLYLLAGKMRRFMGPGNRHSDFKRNPVCLWRRGDPSFGGLGSGSGRGAFLAGLAWIHQGVEGLLLTGLLNCGWT